MQYAIESLGNETMKIRLYFSLSDFNAIFHLFSLCMQTIHRHFQSKMYAIPAAFWFLNQIRHSLKVLFSIEKKKKTEMRIVNLIVFMVTAQMLIAHT